MSWKIGKIKVQRTTCVQPGEIVEPYIVVTQGDIDTNLYEDITSIENWFGLSEYDYKFKRRRIQELVPSNDTDWLNLTQSEKFIIASIKATTIERVRDVLGNDMNSIMVNFDQNSQRCRESRFNFCRSILLNNVEKFDALSILQILEQDNLLDRYIIQGIEGTNDQDLIEGLFNFIESTPLSSYNGQTQDPFGNNLGRYESTGILARNISFLPNSQITNKNDLVSVIMNCLREGIY
jgi:hypothetical protein